MLKIFFWPKHLHTSEYKKYHFQQNGATPHTANIVQDWLSSKFGTKFMAKLRWPPRSPYLNPCDYYLWGYLKYVVYYPLPKTWADLKIILKREIKKIPENILKK